MGLFDFLKKDKKTSALTTDNKLPGPTYLEDYTEHINETKKVEPFEWRRKLISNSIMQNDYSIGANQSLSIPNLNMTKVMETTWGAEFVDNIRDAQQYSFEAGGRLQIKTINKTLIFKKL